MIFLPQSPTHLRTQACATEPSRADAPFEDIIDVLAKLSLERAAWTHGCQSREGGKASKCTFTGQNEPTAQPGTLRTEKLMFLHLSVYQGRVTYLETRRKCAEIGFLSPPRDSQGLN